MNRETRAHLAKLREAVRVALELYETDGEMSPLTIAELRELSNA